MLVSRSAKARVAVLALIVSAVAPAAIYLAIAYAVFDVFRLRIWQIPFDPAPSDKALYIPPHDLYEVWFPLTLAATLITKDPLFLPLFALLLLLFFREVKVRAREVAKVATGWRRRLLRPTRVEDGSLTSGQPSGRGASTASAQAPRHPEGQQAVSEYYDEWTSRYLEVFGDTIQACRPANVEDLHEYILSRAGLRDGQRVLDAGCGVCGPSIYFAHNLRIQIEAVTISSLQRDQALDQIEKTDLSDRINVRQGDFHCLSELFSHDSFDTIVFLESFSHAIRPEEVLRGAYEVLKPGGVLYIKDFFRKRCDSKQEKDRVDRVISNVDRTFRVITPSRDRAVDIMSDLGLEEVFVTPVQFAIHDEVWNTFDETHGFDLYDGETPLPWSDWLELKFRKPFQ